MIMNKNQECQENFLKGCNKGVTKKKSSLSRKKLNICITKMKVA